MKCLSVLRVIGLSSFFVMTSCMLSDSYEASFGTGMTRRTLTNLQTFPGSLGGVSATPITDSGNAARPFQVGQSTYPDFVTAAINSCAEQQNTCQLMANNGTGTFTVTDCTAQQTSCDKAGSSATVTNFVVLVSQDANFDYICDTAND